MGYPIIELNQHGASPTTDWNYIRGMYRFAGVTCRTTYIHTRGIAINTLYISRNARANIYYAGSGISFNKMKKRRGKKIVDQSCKLVEKWLWRSANIDIIYCIWQRNIGSRKGGKIWYLKRVENYSQVSSSNIGFEISNDVDQRQQREFLSDVDIEHRKDWTKIEIGTKMKRANVSVSLFLSLERRREY